MNISAGGGKSNIVKGHLYRIPQGRRGRLWRKGMPPIPTNYIPALPEPTPLPHQVAPDTSVVRLDLQQGTDQAA